MSTAIRQFLKKKPYFPFGHFMGFLGAINGFENGCSLFANKYNDPQFLKNTPTSRIIFDGIQYIISGTSLGLLIGYTYPITFPTIYMLNLYVN